MNRSSYLLGDIQFSSVHISLVRSRSRSSLKNHFDQLSFPFTCSNNYPIIIRITFGKCLIMPASWLVKTVSKYLPPPLLSLPERTGREEKKIIIIITTKDRSTNFDETHDWITNLWAYVSREWITRIFRELCLKKNK